MKTPTLLAALLAAVPASARDRIGLHPIAMPTGHQRHAGLVAAWVHEGAATLPRVLAFDLLTRSACLPDEGPCLAAVARKAGVAEVISASVSERPQGYAFRLWRWQADGRLGSEHRGEVSGGPLDLAGALEHGVCRVLGAAPCLGELRVDGPASARVFVDGEDRGALPLAAPLTMIVGRHSVRVGSHEERVRISYGRSARVATAVAPAVRASPLPPSLFATPAAAAPPAARATAARFLFAGGAALLAAGAGVGLYARVESARLDSRYASGALVEADRPRYGTVRAAGIAATALVASGLGALVCGGIVFAATPAGVSVGVGF